MSASSAAPLLRDSAPLIVRAARALESAVDRVRAFPVASPLALREAWDERVGHPADPNHRPHMLAGLDWLRRAQDATGTGGIARGYGLVRDPYFRMRGWQAAYPETTGYIIPTLYLAARHLDQPDLAERAEYAARWEVEVQLGSGAVRGGVIGQSTSPAVFNTGQVIFGWLAAWEETGAELFAAAARRAGRYLVSTLDDDGHWRRGASPFADPAPALYNARTAWALAEAGKRLGEPEFTAAAARSLQAVAQLQHDDGWFPDCCLTDASRPLLHTIAYAIRGLLEGGRVLEDEHLMDSASGAAGRLVELVGPDGWMAGRFGPGWSPAVTWSCLTAQAQVANIWLRLCEITGSRHWLEPVTPVLRFLKSTQNRSSSNPGLRGGIKGSFPVSGDYGRYQVLNWATKFFVDALIRHERLPVRSIGGWSDSSALA